MAKSENKASEQETLDPIDVRLDRILSKYVSIWLFSILFGSTSALLFSFSTTRVNDASRTFALLILILEYTGAMFSIAALFLLFRYFSVYISKTFFSTSSSLEDEALLKRRGQGFLQNAFYFLLIAYTVKILVFVTNQVFTSLGSSVLF